MTVLVILDFDGTFTNVDEEGAPFEEVYKRELGGVLGRDVSRLWAEAAEELRRDPEAGWRVNDRVVAPADSDPYIQSSCIAFKICDRLDILPTSKIRTDVLQSLYGFAYHYTRISFRPEAAEALKRLVDMGVALRVVTNSETSVVQRKLETLGFPQVAVIGSARKYVVDKLPKEHPQFSALKDLAVPGLQRPLLAQRPYYFEVLQHLWAEHNVGPERTIVCGDIFELDLLLPMSLGTRGHLVTRPSTRAFERAAVQQFERGTISDDLLAFADVVKGLL